MIDPTLVLIEHELIDIIGILTKENKVYNNIYIIEELCHRFIRKFLNLV